MSEKVVSVSLPLPDGAGAGLGTSAAMPVRHFWLNLDTFEVRYGEGRDLGACGPIEKVLAQQIPHAVQFGKF